MSGENEILTEIHRPRRVGEQSRRTIEYSHYPFPAIQSLPSAASVAVTITGVNAAGEGIPSAPVTATVA